MKKILLLVLLFSLSQATFARPKDPKYKIGRKLNRVAIAAVGTAFLINIIRVVKISK